MPQCVPERTHQSGRDIVWPDLTRQIQVTCLRPAQFARTRSRQGARRHQLHDAVHASDRPHPLANLVAQACALVIVGRAAMHQHRRGFLAARRGDREGRDVALLEAG